MRRKLEPQAWEADGSSCSRRLAAHMRAPVQLALRRLVLLPIPPRKHLQLHTYSSHMSRQEQPQEREDFATRHKHFVCMSICTCNHVGGKCLSHMRAQIDSVTWMCHRLTQNRPI